MECSTEEGESSRCLYIFDLLVMILPHPCLSPVCRHTSILCLSESLNTAIEASLDVVGNIDYSISVFWISESFRLAYL